MSSAVPVTVAAADPSTPEARAVLRAYFEELVSRYHRRPARPEEVDAAMAAEPSHDLVAPTGTFLLARAAGVAVGCVGLRFRPDRVGEVTRMFVTPAERGRGIGFGLLTELEAVARQRGITRLQLDTRDDLVEARRLYARFGFEEVPAFNSGPYAEHWFSKRLDR